MRWFRLLALLAGGLGGCQGDAYCGFEFADDPCVDAAVDAAERGFADGKLCKQTGTADIITANLAEVTPYCCGDAECEPSARRLITRCVDDTYALAWSEASAACPR
jgi:hypothetical protein